MLFNFLMALAGIFLSLSFICQAVVLLRLIRRVSALERTVIWENNPP